MTVLKSASRGPGLSCGWVNYVGCIEDTLFS